MGSKKIKKTPEIIWSTVLGIFSWLLLALFSESGPRATHVNFIWSLGLCQSIVFLYSFISFYNELLMDRSNVTTFKSIKAAACYVAATLHVCMGVFYFYHILNGGNIMEML